jgi:lipopolysaccharide transport system ATP-binding protein
MSSEEVAISVRGLSKRYIINHREHATSLAEAALGFLRNPFKAMDKEELWSLNDVSFDVQKGEILGLVGRNGAGKSTLLKVLSRISEPTRGAATLRGRLGSLIEVGTGFQPELTGRENVYLNGAILGMTRKEITRRFDEIVAFSGVEKYLDTPVKRYSSGMYVRLAFAVAVHLDTDILLIDEVLAVGDADFQAKSVRKMMEVAKSGKTILVVSHNAATIQTLCTRALLLRSGCVVNTGPVSDIIQEYNQMSAGAGSSENSGLRIEYDEGYFRSVDFLNSDMTPTRIFTVGEEIIVDLEIDAPDTIRRPTVTLTVLNAFGGRTVVARSPCNERALPDLKGLRRVTCVLSKFAIMPGEYSMKIELGSEEMPLDTLQRNLHFTLTAGDPYDDGWGSVAGGYVIARRLAGRLTPRRGGDCVAGERRRGAARRRQAAPL